MAARLRSFHSFFLDPIPGMTAPLFDIALGPSGKAVIVGDEGTILVRAADGGAFKPEPVPDVPASLYQNDFGPGDEAAIVGRDGTILTRSPNGDAFQPASVPGMSAWLNNIAFGPNGEAIIVGRDGTILIRAADGDAFKPAPVPGMSAWLTNIAFGPSGEAVIIGDNGAILVRGPNGGPFQPASVPSITEPLFGIVFGPSGEAIIVGNGSTILTQRPEFAAALDATETVEMLDAAIQAIPNHARLQADFEALAALRARMDRANAAIHEWQGRLEETRDRLMGLSEVSSAPVTDNAWISALLERLPGVILLLFLLATFGTLYRYNLRMVGFYHARADALELIATPDIDRERLTALAEVRAAEKVDFKDAKTQIDTITDIAKEAIKKVK